MTWGRFGNFLASIDDDKRPAGPELPDWLHWVWRAWTRLHHDRPWIGGGMAPAAPGRIPWASVLRWCEHHGHSADDMAFLDRCFAALDDAYIGWWSEQAKVKK